jgi:hypothetical protein
MKGLVIDMKEMQNKMLMRDVETARSNATQNEMKLKYGAEINRLDSLIGNVELNVNN